MPQHVRSEAQNSCDHCMWGRVRCTVKTHYTTVEVANKGEPPWAVESSSERWLCDLNALTLSYIIWYTFRGPPCPQTAVNQHKREALNCIHTVRHGVAYNYHDMKRNCGDRTRPDNVYSYWLLQTAEALNCIYTVSLAGPTMLVTWAPNMVVTPVLSILNVSAHLAKMQV